MSRFNDQQYEEVPVGQLREHPRNPRRGNTEAIDESMEVNGWFGAVVAQKSTRYILAGNHSYRVAKRRGAKTVPTLWKDVDDEGALRILLADNRTAELGGYDEAALEEAMNGLESLEGTGWVLRSVQEAEESPEAENGAGDPVPDDRYEAQYAVVVACPSEGAQEAMYEWLRTYADEALEPVGDHAWGEFEVRVVAV